MAKSTASVGVDPGIACGVWAVDNDQWAGKFGMDASGFGPVCLRVGHRRFC